MIIIRTFRTMLRLSVPVAGVAVCLLAFAVAPAMAEFGVAKFAVSAREENGTPDVQAGSHPYGLTVTLVLNETAKPENLKDVRLQLPPGLVGNPNATPKCTYQEFIRQVKSSPEPGQCPDDTVIGLATFYGQEHPGLAEAGSSAVYNLVPPVGVAAEFGYVGLGLVPVVLSSSVRTGSDYGVTTTAADVGEATKIYASKVTIWGVPADHAHDPWRGSCLNTRITGQYPVEPGFGLDEGEDELEGPLHFKSEEYEPEGLPTSNGGECAAGVAPKPFLTLPTSCGRPLTATVSVDSWQEPGDFVGPEGDRTRTASLPELTGCGELPFTPGLTVKPGTEAASTPTGVGFELGLPQESTEATSGLAEADLKGYRVVLPEGLQLNASAVNGLQSCSPAQIGFTGFAELDPTGEPGVQTPQFTPGAPACPEASKLGTVSIKSPLLEGVLHGGVYLAAPQNFKGGPLENPFKSLTAMYVVAEEERTGVIVKLPGDIERNPVTGQLTALLSNSPQLPFTTANLEFFPGQRAPLATGARCGTFTTEASFEAWSTKALQTNPTFGITTGPGGTPCPSGALPFSPSLVSEATNVDAGAFSPLSTVINREDGQQAIKNVTLTYPPGVSAVLTGVPECGEAQANAGSCGAESLIGEDTAEVGLGSDPYTVTGGKIYLTGPYDGAPFGLSIVTPTQAGPFVLEEGRPVITRAKIEINPVTAGVTVTTGEIPHILDGIQLQVKQIYANINRPGFAINPTSCEKMTVTGSVGGWEGASSPFSDPFQVADCSALKFEPKIAVSTGAHSSKKNGADLDIKVSYPAGAIGSQAWLKEAKLVIPKQLPAELKTIQQACLAATFEANPAGCPAHSKIGEAVVHTQLLPVPLKGPIYFVSYGAAKFPDAIVLLSGDNVNLRLTSETYIHNGITSVTLPEIPGVPFESSEFILPNGEYSEFGTNLGLGDYDFCGQKLTVPTEFKAQNGLEVHEETPVTVTGCPTSISIQSKSIKKRTLTLTVYVPAAGKLTATGKGLPTKTKTAKGQELLTFTLTPTKTTKLKTTIKLTYTPTHGKKQTTTTKTSIKP